MIGFVSSGFNPPDSFTTEEVGFLRKCKKIVVDTYTSSNYLKEFEERDLVFADRNMLEDFEWIFGEKEDIAIVVPGECFSATTHFTIYKEATERGVSISVFHNSSIYPTAAIVMGLHMYKVGPAISLPRFTEKFRPLSPYEKIVDNLKRNLHTIVLLDTLPPLSVEDALKEIEWMEKEAKGNLFTEDLELGVICSLGTAKEKLCFGKIRDIKTIKALPTPCTLVIPADLHFEEKEAIELFRFEKI